MWCMNVSLSLLLSLRLITCRITLRQTHMHVRPRAFADIHALVSLRLNVCVITSVIIRIAFKLYWYWKVWSQREVLTFPWTCRHTHTRRHAHMVAHAIFPAPITHIHVYTHVHTISLINRHISASVAPTPHATAVCVCVLNKDSREKHIAEVHGEVHEIIYTWLLLWPHDENNGCNVESNYYHSLYWLNILMNMLMRMLRKNCLRSPLV